MVDRTDRYSHYQHDGTPVPLVRHQRDVAKRATYLAPKRAITCSGTDITEITRIVALVHDFGKLTTAFQRHLDGVSVSEDTSHAPLGAFAGFYAIRASGYDDVDALIGFIAIAKHHGTLPDVTDYVFNHTHPDQEQGKRRIPIVREHANDIDNNAAKLADEILSDATNGAGSWDRFADAIQRNEWLLNVLNLVTSDIGPPTSAQVDALPDNFYDAVLPVWSTLTVADKTSAAALTSGAEFDTSAYDGRLPSLSKIEDKIANLKSSLDPDATADEQRIHKLRGDAHKEVMASINDFTSADMSVASLTLPTGLGKTLTGLNAGLELLSRNNAENGRLIYVLPFTSIIDQVSSECCDVFETNGHDDVLTVDHHLAETVIDTVDLDVSDPDATAHIEELLGRSWRSGMVITTFVQLFESVAGPSNSRSIKLPALDNSVIIIDEPQALPEEWWPLIRRLVMILTEQYDVQVIVMTATQPKVFEQDSKTTYQLIEQPKQYYAELDRVIFELDESADTFIRGEPDPLDYATAAERLLTEIDPESSTLAICNTIDSARELTEALMNRFDFTSLNEEYNEYLSDFGKLTTDLSPDEIVESVRSSRDQGEPVVLHLTTRHRPVDRRLLLEVTKQLQSADIPVFAVTTQLVEAGVDISFDHVFRDFAPMSSIVQAAGRCNRSFERNRGTVTVWLLESPAESQRLPAIAVYGGDNEESRPKLTAQAIAACRDNGSERRFSETMMSWDVVTDYFERLQNRNPGQQDYVSLVTNSQAKQLGQLSLINSGRAVDVVVARTTSEEKLLRDIDKTFDDYEFGRLEKLLDDTQELQVSIPLYDEASEEARRISNLNPVHAGATLRQVKTRTDQHDAYSPLTGLSIPSASVDNRFL